MKDEQVNHVWQWQKVENGAYLTCSLLSPWRHGFFTKDFYPRTPEELTSILQTDTKAYRVKQVHGDRILTPQEITNEITLSRSLEIATQDLPNGFSNGDAVISDDANQSVWVASADCTPILIGDRVTGRVCAIHAGWRGTSQTIAKKAIAQFIKSGSQPENLRIAIGPAIAGKIYQVDNSVAIKVGKTIIVDAEDKTDTEIFKELQQLANSPILDDELPGKVRLDVPRVNQIQLEQLGINSVHIAIAQDFCTYQQSDCFFSYRRTGEKKVQWSGIVSSNI